MPSSIASANGAAHSSISGPDYLSALAAFIRTHESSLANYYAPRPKQARTHTPPSWTTVLTLGIVPTAESSSSPGSAPRAPSPAPPRRDPLVLKFDPHHLYYLLLKFDELGISGAGDLDVKVDGGTSRPMSVDYSSLADLPGFTGAGEPSGNGGGSGSILGGMFGLGSGSGNGTAVRRKRDGDDSMSLQSGISSFSFGSGWWGLGGGAKDQPPADEASNVRYIYSSCTKLPALKLSPFRFTAAPEPGSKTKDSTPALVRVVEGFDDCPPQDTCVPLLAFKNLSSLVLDDLDPRGFYGWDVLSVQLRSLEVHRGGIEDVGELICDAPVEDAERRAATERRDRAVGSERRRRAEGSASTASVGAAPMADDDKPAAAPPSPATAAYPTPSKLAWSSLRHLSLSDNSLTFIPSPPLAFLPMLTSLDLSSNLLISIPPGLAHLSSLRSLNLSDNMIDSLLGVAKALGAIEVLNLSKNRLENLSGLDRLPALERLDVRENHLSEALEVSRVARLPHLREVWVRGNPFARKREEGGEENWRVKCFTYFADEEAHGHRDLAAGEIRLDGAAMTGSERRAVEAESCRRGTPLGRRRASVSAPERVAVSGNGEAKVVGRRVVTAPHRGPHHHHHGEASSSSLATSPPPLPLALSSSPVKPAAVSAVPTKSPAKPKRRKPRRVVDLDADPSASSAVARHSDSEPTSSGAETSRPTAPRGARPSTVAEEPDSTTTTTDSSSSPYPASPSKPSSSSTPRTSRLAGVSSLGPSSSSPTSSPSSKRRARVSASTYEPAPSSSPPTDPAERSGEAFRRRIEKLREEVGDHYLSVLGEREAMAEMEKQRGGATKEAGEVKKPEAVKAEPKKEEVTVPPAPTPSVDAVPPSVVDSTLEQAAAEQVDQPADSASGTGETEEAGPAPVEAEGNGGEEEQEAAAVAPAMKQGVKVVKKKKKGKGKRK
ncbi:hypothetical protein JCM8097_004797 [Rhodosporidiobolus ruineniae]